MAAITKTLSELAKVVRSKNSGPFELTFDVICNDMQNYTAIKTSGILTKSLIADLYRIPLDSVLVAEFFDQAMAFKATIIRPIDSGSVGETDTYGGQQGAPLLDVRVPINGSV